MESGPKKIHFARSFIVKSPQISTKEFNINEKISCFQNRNPKFRYPRWSSEIIAFERVCNSFYNQIWQYILTIFRYCIYVEFLRKSIEWCVFERVNYYTAVVVCAQNWQIWRLESGWKKIVLASSTNIKLIRLIHFSSWVFYQILNLSSIVKLIISRNTQLLLSKASTRSWVWVSISLNTQHNNTHFEWTKLIKYKILYQT